VLALFQHKNGKNPEPHPATFLHALNETKLFFSMFYLVDLIEKCIFAAVILIEKCKN